MRLDAGTEHWGLRHAAERTLPFWLLWGAAAPLVRWFTHRYPLVPRLRIAPLVTHLTGGLAIAGGVTAARGVAEALLMDHPVRSSLAAYPGWLATNVMMYAVIAAVVSWGAVVASAQRHERDVALSRAEAVSARLHTLQSQLEPHFLFNALNSVTMLIRANRGADAVRMISSLSDLLRTAFQTRAPEMVPLGEEIALLRNYLAIEQVRFADRLHVTIELPEDLVRVPVPRLILQPLVENAVRHGIARHPSAGRITIAAQRRGARLALEVTDDGLGPGGGQEGTGLANVRERLRLLFGAEARVSLTRRDECTVAGLEFPLAPDPQ
jgi:LytS/YehU family sensor histidine kinase